MNRKITKKQIIASLFLVAMIIQVFYPIILLDNQNVNGRSTKEFNMESASIDESGFINDWLYTGTFDGANHWDSYPTINGTQILGPNSTIYYEEYDSVQVNQSMDSIDDSKVWWRYESPDSTINLQNLFPNSFNSNKTAYFLTYVYFPEDVTEVFSYIGSDDGVRLFHNGSEIYYNHSIRDYIQDEDIFSIGAIESGWHSFFLLLEGSELTENWRFSFRLSDSESSFNEISGLSVDLRYKNQQIERFIFLSDEEIHSLTFANFTKIGGTINKESTPWQNINGFSGSINSSLINYFKANISQNIEAVPDSIIKAQMNTVHNQIGTYPYCLDVSGFGLTGNSNSSIAILDSGIDDSHIMFNESYENLNFSRNIIGWKDFVNETPSEIPYDDNGHGTALASIIVGGGESSLSPYNDGKNYHFTLGGNFSHKQLFQPNHVTPGRYNLKLGSFKITSLESSIIINATMAELTQQSNIDSYRLDLYLNGDLIESFNQMNFSFTTSEDYIGQFDIVFSYTILIEQLPEFNILINGTFVPSENLGSFANFTGIAPDTKIVSLKVLNNSGIGYISDLILALDWVHENNIDYQITAITLSIGNFDIGEMLTNEISNLITKIIQKGTMVIIAAGNEGVGSRKLNRLAINSKAIVVGAINSKDQLTYYSSQGLVNEEGIIRPDIVAPGGSLLLGESMIITAETNFPDNNTVELKENDLTAIYGTSAATSIVSGAFQLIVEMLGGWNEWDSTTEKDALFVKSLLLMTSTETNNIRENNPQTTIDESLSSPQINRIGSDIHEGFGKINPEAALSLLNNSISLGEPIIKTLNSSLDNPYGKHIFAVNLSVEKDTIYNINLTVDAGLDADIIIYNSSPDEFGRPVVVASSTQVGQGVDEIFNYNHIGNDQTLYVCVKSVSGSGNISLEINQVQVDDLPQLNNLVVESTTGYNDTLDYFTFRVNYTQAENLAPNYIYFRTNATNYQNITMIKENPVNNNYIDGVWYTTEIKFHDIGDFGFHFFVQTGDKFFNYTDISNEEFLITVNQVNNLINIEDYFDYDNYFKQLTDTNLWEFESEEIGIEIDGISTNVYLGWDWINVHNILEPRYTSFIDTNWGALYFGITGEIGIPNIPLIVDGKPLYSYNGLTGTHDLISPHVFVNLTKETIDDPFVKMGIRTSIAAGDSIQIQINSNRTGWITLETFSNEEFDWKMVMYDLTEYDQTYIQFRIRSNIIGIPQQYSKGFMLDYFALFDNNATNEHAPMLSKAQNLNYDNIPYVRSNNNEDLNTIFDLYTFTISYNDEDGNYPEYIYLEINNRNYSMINTYGRWNVDPNFIEYKIQYQIEIPIYNFQNTSFRFHTFDGKYYYSTSFKEEIQFDEISLEDHIKLPFNSTIVNDFHEKITVVGEPTPIQKTNWLTADNTWHQVETYGIVNNPDEWYCGQGSYLGYGRNWNASLIFPFIELNGTNEIFFEFEHNLGLSEIFNNQDYGQVLISSNFGETWDVLEVFDAQTNGYRKEILDLTEYLNTVSLIKFNFVSDSTGMSNIPNSGWRIQNFKIDINRSRDYEKPTISFWNIEDGQRVSNIVEFSITITDNFPTPLDTELMQFYINIEQINVSEYFNTSTNTLNYSIDTWQYTNGQVIEIVFIVIDSQGNRAIEKRTLVVHNQYRDWELTLIILIPLLFGLAMIYKLAKNRKIRKLMAKGDFVPKPGFRDRLMQKRFAKEREREEVELIYDVVNQNEELQEWEKAQPFYMNCKSCNSWFNTEDFEIFCPACGNDSLYVAQKCPICEDWKYFESIGKHRCKKCDIELVKDFEKTKKRVLLFQNEEFRKEKEKKSKSKKELVNELIEKLPKEKLLKLLEEQKENNQGTGGI